MVKTNIIDPFRKFLSIEHKAKAMFFEAVFMALSYRTLIGLVPFRWWSKYIAKTSHLLSANNQSDSKTIKLVFRAMRRSSVYLPFKEKCLIDALVMKKMLQRRHISSTLYLGLTKDEKNDLMAHAWLIHENKIIAGMKGAAKFTEIKRYE